MVVRDAAREMERAFIEGAAVVRLN
jgi:hypothetical protein